MKRVISVLIILALAITLLAACTPEQDGDVHILPIDNGTGEQEQPLGVPARPGSEASGDPSVNLPDLVEVSGAVKEVNDGLVLITQCDGSGDFMLRFSENSKWDEGVSREIQTGNTITCLVKLEPTFAPPSQGEVYEVTANTAK